MLPNQTQLADWWQRLRWYPLVAAAAALLTWAYMRGQASQQASAALQAERTVQSSFVRGEQHSEASGRIEAKQVKRARVVQRTRKETRPDGTQVETKTIVHEAGESSAAAREVQTSDTRVVERRDVTIEERIQFQGVAPTNRRFVRVGYRLVGGGAITGRIDAGTIGELELGGGLRLADTPFWLTVTALPAARIKDNKLHVGVQMEW